MPIILSQLYILWFGSVSRYESCPLNLCPAEAGATAGAADGDGAAPAAEAGRHSFGAKKKLQKRSKASAAGGVGASKAVRNPGLLSFDEDDEP